LISQNGSKSGGRPSASRKRSGGKFICGFMDYKVVIQTPEGNMTAALGDWIIKGVKGEFYPCKPDIFEETYERVEEPE
jgi:hypothetical protein